MVIFLGTNLKDLFIILDVGVFFDTVDEGELSIFTLNDITSYDASLDQIKNTILRLLITFVYVGIFAEIDITCAILYIPPG